ncbi:MAG TPA: DUF3800 domain-containing protein [Pyrinomonadaceae bacterium]|nr:DUF3800 domain-containing protein [Pyrinomonadaceae bacterium]
MLTCYVDESTAFGETDPATSVAGYVATGKQWATFGRAWNLMLKHYGVEIFHTKEIETAEGRKRSIYKGWSKKKREEFQNEIIAIIRESGLQDVGAAIPLSVYRAAMTPQRIKKYGKTPDGLCALVAMMQATGYAWDNIAVYKQAPVFIYERGGLCRKVLEWAHDELKESKLYRDFFSLSTLRSEPKSKEFPQLQAADYLAFNISKRCSHVVDPNPPAVANLETLADGKKVRPMRYPLQALYAGGGSSNVCHAPTTERLEALLQVIEADDDPA